jgi:hypothetical protein
MTSPDEELLLVDFDGRRARDEFGRVTTDPDVVICQGLDDPQHQ